MRPSRRAMMKMIAGASAVPALETAARPASAALVSSSDIASNSVNVRDFGARGDGKNDDTAAIQAALAALAKTGGEIVFPHGDYLHTGIEVGKVGVYAEGALRLTSLAPASEGRGPYGREGARLICTSPTASHLKFNDCQRIILDGLAFTTAQGITPTSGYGLHVNGGMRVVVTKCLFEGCFNSVFIDANRKPFLEHVEIRNAKGEFGLRVAGRKTVPVDQGHVENVFVHTATAQGSSTTDGVQVGDYTHSINWLFVATNQCRRGLVIGDGTSASPAFHRFCGFDAENTFEEGILIQNGTHLWLHDVYSCVNRLHGVRVTSNYVNSQGGPIWFADGRFSGNGRHGALLESCSGVTFSGCKFAANSQPNEPGGGPTNIYDGIHVTAPKAFLDVIGCRIGGSILEHSDTNGDQRYGIYLAKTVKTPHIRIIGNDLSGNTSGCIRDLSSALATKAILGNIGPGLQGTATRDWGEVGDAVVRPVFDYPVHRVTAAGRLDIDLSAAGFPVGQPGEIEVIVRMDGVGGHTVTFRGVTHWDADVPPTLATSVGAVNRLTFASDDGGGSVMGALTFRSQRPAGK